jgi:hypothetical protein
MSGYVFSDGLLGSTSCVSMDEDCKNDHGYGSEYSYLKNQCVCKSGYLIENNKCVLGSNVCTNKYGYGATYDYLSKSCECSYGYVWGTDVLGNASCITDNQACKNQYGSNAQSTYGDKCECRSGYEFTQTGSGLSCVSCTLKYGIDSKFNYLSKSCECNDGYTLKEGQCVEKQNNVYFVLKELDNSNNNAIIYSDYENRYYKVSYGIGCSSYNFEDYVGENIVINLGTDFDLSIWDKIVLQDDNQTCSILGVNSVSSSFTLHENEENSFITPLPPLSNLNLLSLKNSVVDQKLIDRMKGRILLQVESGGEAWYVRPTDGKRLYMKDGGIAYTMMRDYGLGITNTDLAKIPAVNNEKAMLEASSVCSTNSTANRVKGRILLQVDQNGEAWYVHPDKCRRIYLKDGGAAYQIMRFLSLGITNTDLEKIPIGEF